ncbi:MULTISPECIES: HlyD family secretion protein [unclassified Arsukibacterium]|uniref:HlyD family secretion protein n=1 Tax=unclassified Arsukibacterium TaxID=2635278 RepID=UPI000C3B02A2|nr:MULTISPECIES: HlyD family efflux transporter periplasmic adaptor subunit [unclassified Arsukibacterium]MAA95946.1 multidrug transporter [Rheinheimera sp.]MBM34750.1 multidrug transporter [Rheinheimera sp.]HAW91662.1 multidrug transporter [Candidatus Azambacteria bacterium]
MAEQGLFRANAVKQQSARLDGDVIIAQPLSSTVLTTILLCVVVAIVVFLSVTSFNRKETVTGYLKPDIGLAKVVSSRAGVIQQVFVEDGQQVKAGDRLALVTIPEHLSAGDSLTGTLFQGLVQQTELVTLRKQQLVSQFSQQETEYRNRLTLSHNLLDDIAAQQQLLQQRLQLNQQRQQDFQGLHKRGAISTTELQQQQELVLNIRQQLAELNANEQNHKAQLAQLSGLLQRLPSEREQQLALLDSDISRLQQQQTELNARGEMLITAPISGRVTNLVAEIGNNVRVGLPLLTIMPDNAQLQAILLVPTRAYGFVMPGQRTRLRFDAFPYQRFGLYEGQVIKTAQAIVLPNEVDMPVAVQEPVYRVQVALDSQLIRAYGNTVPLQSGMLLSADIVLEQRSLLAWLFEPILSLKGRL